MLQVGLKLSTVFRAVEAAKTALRLRSYAVSQTTLEQVRPAPSFAPGHWRRLSLLLVQLRCELWLPLRVAAQVFLMKAREQGPEDDEDDVATAGRLGGRIPWGR